MDDPHCGDLYSWGNDKEQPSSITPNVGFRGDRLTNICGGYGSAAIISPSSVQFSKLSKKHTVAPADLPRDIRDISFGETHALAATKGGTLYAWGHNKWGQVGLGAKASISTKPQLIKGALDGKVIVQVSCGAAHSAALTDTGDVYTWGRGFEGQTGHASKALDAETNAIITSVQLLPKCVSAFVKDPVSSISCGHNFTCVVTKSGGVWSWGEGGSGQLGFGR